MAKRVLTPHLVEFDRKNRTIVSFIYEGESGISVKDARDMADIINTQHAAALDALAEARKRLEKAADDFIGEGMDWNAQQIYDYLKTSAPAEER